MTRRHFGTDGIRGPYRGPVVNDAFARRLGVAVGRWTKESNRSAPSFVLIGRDTRRSGRPLEQALAAGFNASLVSAVSLGILPTPAVARAVRVTGAALGAVITASHNPADENGFKFFGPDGRKLTDGQEAAIEALLPEPGAEYGPGFLGAPQAGSAAAEYVSAAVGLMPPGCLEGWRIVLDTANGAACETSPEAFRSLGAEVVGIGDAPNGDNINAGVGSQHPEGLLLRVREAGARLGVAHDGDGDRCVLCDERGAILDGDELLTILATHALSLGRLPGKALVVTVQSNLGVDAAVAAAGGRVLRTAIGDRQVAERMAVEGAVLGGESSGHLIFWDVSPTGDGLVAALKVIEVMRETGLPLSELRKVLVKFPQATAALPVAAKKPLEGLPGLAAAIREVEGSLGGKGRVLVRYSGTESVLRFLVEGPDKAGVDAEMARLVAAAKAELAPGSL